MDIYTFLVITVVGHALVLIGIRLLPVSDMIKHALYAAVVIIAFTVIVMRVLPHFLEG